ncbi:YdcH family protein [Hyphobacterium sp.]|uniref:YdcH family protein n=1 Tax=Hyphobacterium sp. TaxID=2004662 RepID=UPI003BAA7D34
MSEDEFLEKSTLRAKIDELKFRHRSLDSEVQALQELGVSDQLKVARLKKEKLQLKDRIASLEDRLMPDIIA